VFHLVSGKLPDERTERKAAKRKRISGKGVGEIFG
jgi:hypothetical protein